MRIGVDIDGTVADYNPETTLKRHTGRKISDDLFICYMEAAVEAKPSKELYDAYREYALKKAKLVKDSTSVIERLKDKGHDIVIYSNRTVFLTPAELTEWLKDNLIPFSEVWAQKAFPVPVMYTARMASSFSQTSKASRISIRMAWCIELNTSGRLKVMRATAFSTLKIM